MSYCGPTIMCLRCGQQAWIIRALNMGGISELECAVCHSDLGIRTDGCMVDLGAAEREVCVKIAERLLLNAVENGNLANGANCISQLTNHGATEVLRDLIAAIRARGKLRM